MEYRQCERCIFFGLCNEIESCDNFSPFESDIEDIVIEKEVIDIGRRDFYSEWFNYVGQYEDDFID